MTALRLLHTLARKGLAPQTAAGKRWLFSHTPPRIAFAPRLMTTQAPPAPDPTRGNKLRWPGRVSAALWAAQPSPVALVHFVCIAWPGR